MSRVTEINKGIFLQQDTQSPTQVLPAQSVGYTQLDSTLNADVLASVAAVPRLTRLSDYVVGTAGDFVLGKANFTSLVTALTAAPTGSFVYMLPGVYNVGNITISFISSKNLTLIGAGLQTQLLGNITFDVKYWAIQNLNFGNNIVLASSSLSCAFANCWQPASSTWTDNGTGNLYQVLDT